MTIQVQLYDTKTMLGLYTHVEAPSTYFLDLLFQTVVNFDDEFIDFEKVKRGRKLAPLVVPTAQGRPIYSEASSMTRLKPAYVKPKDPVSPGRAIKKRPGELALNQPVLSPLQRFNAIVGDISREHRESITRREEWMAARAIIDGSVTLVGEDYPEVVLDFNRAAGHTVVLSGTDAWNNGSYAGSMMDDINGWIATVRQAEFGGPVTRITVAPDVLPVLLSDAKVKEQLDINQRGTSANLNTGLLAGDYVEYIGNLGPNVQLWVNGDYYETATGTTERFLADGDIVLTGPAVMGARCYGAILDHDAGFQAMPVFPKMWKSDDPSGVFVMHQSAPLPVPVNPNATFKATVLE